MFRGLKPGSPERTKLWDDNQEYLRGLLEEISRDVYDGKITISENGSWRGTSMTLPNLILEIQWHVQLGISTYSETTFLVGLHHYMNDYYNRDVSKDQIPAVLRSLLKIALA